MVAFSLLSLKFVDYRKTFFLLIIFSIINIDQGAKYSELYIKGQYFFGIIVSFFFFSFYKKLVPVYLLIVLETILWINFVLIFIGFFYEIPLFRTYGNGFRFGYNGLFKSTSVATYFYMFSFILFFLKKKTRYNYCLLFNLIIALLFIGSKSAYLYLFFVSLFLIVKVIFNMRVIKKTKLFFGLFIAVSISIGVVILKLIFTLNSVLKDVLETDGIVTAFFSYRDQLVKNVLLIVKEKYNLKDYLFGGLEHVPRLTEIAIVDLVITFGAIGGGVYGYFFAHNFPVLKKIELKFMLSVIGLIIMLRGNFFYFPSVIYMSIVIFALIVKTEESNNMSLKMD